MLVDSRGLEVRGPRLSRQSTYTWDARNHLTGISGGASASFVYDAFGRRVSKTINGTTTQFLYDGLNPVQELNGSNPPTPTASLLTGLSMDEYFTRTDSNGAMSFLRDALGSTIALANSSGAIATQYTYEPFGNTTVSGSSNANPYQFTGRENDGTGLYYFRARYYSPAFQRFIAQDPIGFAGGDTNLYALTYNDPLNLRDPRGLFPWFKILVPLTISSFNSDPCSLGHYLAMIGGMGGNAVGGIVGETVGATAGFFAGEFFVPFGGGFPGAFAGGMVGLGAGSASGLVTGNLFGGYVGDKLGAAFGMPGCDPNKPCGQSR